MPQLVTRSGESRVYGKAGLRWQKAAFDENLSMNSLLAAVAGAASAIIVGIAIPLIRRRVPPNALYGLRVPATFADDEVWYDANALFGRDLLWLGSLLIAIIITIFALGLGVLAYLVWAGVLFAGAIGTGIVGWLRANRMLNDKRRAP